LIVSEERSSCPRPRALGFTEADIPKLVEGTLPQHRVTKLSPRPASAEDLAGLFRDAMRYW